MDQPIKINIPDTPKVAISKFRRDFENLVFTFPAPTAEAEEWFREQALDARDEEERKYQEEAEYDSDYAEQTGEYVERSPEPEGSKLVRIARQALPKDSPEIQTALAEIADLNVSALVTAEIVEQTWRGTLHDEEVDKMTTAALLMGASNAEKIIEHFEADTMSNIEQFMVAMSSVEDQVKGEHISYTDYSDSARRLLIASTAAFLDIIKVGVQSGSVKPKDLPVYEFSKRAVILQSESRTNSRAKRDEDFMLMGRVFRLFNALSDFGDMPFRLAENSDNTFTIVKGGTKPGAKPTTPKM